MCLGTVHKILRQPVVSTYLAGNHAVIDPRWRYIRYHDGGEELYDRLRDPHEYHNLASRPEHAAVKARLRALVPQSSAAPKPQKDAFDFDFSTHTYRRKGS